MSGRADIVAADVARDNRIPTLYLAPWVDLGGSDKATVDWFRWLDRERFAPALITTQPSRNRWLKEVRPYATEVWALPDLMPADAFPTMVFEFIRSRGIELVHIMNSKIGFDLLPDLASMKPRPATVVQLHVEEEDRSGYVRYVTTRYGNLVDAFSVSGHHLAAAMADYLVPAGKRRVIHTGVDAGAEYNRDLIAPEPLPGGHFDVLFAARLVAQKDPELMLEIAAQVAREHPHVRFHVIGDGPLEETLRRRAADLELREHVLFHGSRTDLRPWYAACAALLMTSTFEGIPCTVFEAMATKLPIVAPALPGIREALGGTGALIEPRDDVGGYVSALGALIADEPHRRDVAERAHERVREQFGVAAMAGAHADLYDELLADRAARIARDKGSAPAEQAGALAQAAPDDDDDAGAAERSERIALLDRPSSGQPLVSIIVPCFNHGLLLPDCLASLRAQDYPQLEVIVVDDASTDPETQDVIARVGDEGWAHVIRQTRNRGPSAARNAALEVARGRYVLPVDSDNLLLPDAVTRLVAQLQSAGETVGFIYPNAQYFGNRNDYFQAPDYNLHALRLGNFCDTCSLFDRAVFDAGVRFAEDIELGHEDWDLMLLLAERGVRGEPAHGRTLLYRKHGFTRSDSVEYAQESFQLGVPARHHALFADQAIKPRDCPGLSVVVLDEIEPGASLAALAERLRTQSLVDLELIARFDSAWPHPGEVRCVRRVPPGEPDGATEMLALGLQLARSPRVLVVSNGLAELMADTAFLEKVARMATSLPDLDAVAFIDAGVDANPLAPVVAPAELETEPHAVLLHRAHEDDWPESVMVSPTAEIGGLLGCLSNAREAVQWCHLPAEPRTTNPGGEARWVSFARDPPTRIAEERVRWRQVSEPVVMPGVEVLSPRRWSHNIAWTPPETIPLVRHANPVTGWRVVSNSPTPPPGYLIERDLGVVQRASPPGTARLECTSGTAYGVVDRVTPRSADPEIDVLGHVELAPLPLLAALLHATHRPTGRRVLLSGDDDPLMAECDVHGGIGFIEGFPIHPREPRRSRNGDYGLHGLLRAIDARRRRHAYAIDATPSGCELVGELGALLGTPEYGAIALWRTSGGLIRTDAYDPQRATPELALVARWALAPAGWRGFGHHRGRARAVARRLIDARGLLAGQRNGTPSGGDLLGHLFTESAPGRLPLWSGINPVTGDQLLTRHEYEANDMGYTDIALLGFMRERAPVTGTLDLRRAAVPWASRFGLEVRPV
jgi:glycosyltransferase involved in cell wall biosynthesis